MARFHGKKTRLLKPAKTNKAAYKPSRGVLSGILGYFGNIIDFVLQNQRIFSILVIGIITGITLAFASILISDFKNVKSLANFKPNITTKIYDKNDILISELFRQKREVIPLKKIPENLINAFIAMEDNEFRDHYGINIKGIVRAFFINVFSGKIKQGGSTITQQLAKVLLTSRKRNLYRKIKEAFIAIIIELNYTKDNIIEMYLNQIFLGHGAYGVESASKLYFGKHTWELNLAESALIATLPSSPNRLSPIRHPNISMKRHKIALAKMVEMGYIDIPEAEKAYLSFWPAYLSHLSEISPTHNVNSIKIDKAPWFTEYIRRKLIKKYGESLVYDKGLKVYTTLDLKKQVAGQKILKKSLEKQTRVSSKLSFKNEDLIVERYSEMVDLVSNLFDIKPFRRKGSRRNEKLNTFIRNHLIEEFEGLNLLAGLENIDRLIDKYKGTYTQDKELQQVEGCIISINHNNGYIEAMIGGSEFSSINQLNRVMQMRRQPGSAIKPLLYASAIESRKFTAASTILDSPVVYLDNEGGDWLPENYEGEYYGLMRLRKALALSINVISIRIADKLGIDHIIKYLGKFLKLGYLTINKRIPRNFSIALGSLEVSPFELTRAYSIIANGGKDVIPFSIRHIKDREDKVLENREEEVKKLMSEKIKNGTHRIINPDTAQVMINMIKAVIMGGTGSSANPGRAAAGKTGTTNNWKDAWFVGFVPQLTTGIWVGYDRLGLSLGVGQSGGSITAPLWGKYMREAMRHEKKLNFKSFASLSYIDICRSSGLLPTSYCKSTIKEGFIHGTVPEEECGIHNENNVGQVIVKKGPRDNISKTQKNSIIRNMKSRSDDKILKHLEDDLLKDD